MANARGEGGTGGGARGKPGRKAEKGDKTIIYQSTVGRRLAKVRRQEKMFIVFQGRSIPIVSRITIGRDPDNAITLEDILASRQHAVIQKVKDAYYIEDLGSTNGTYVNGRAVPPGKYVRLMPSDTILIGRSELSLRHLR
jgi:pSer/pThr/pTyr-binding forkhead associated (FHA) protein